MWRIWGHLGIVERLTLPIKNSFAHQASFYRSVPFSYLYKFFTSILSVGSQSALSDAIHTHSLSSSPACHSLWIWCSYYSYYTEGAVTSSRWSHFNVDIFSIFGRLYHINSQLLCVFVCFCCYHSNVIGSDAFKTLLLTLTIKINIVAIVDFYCKFVWSVWSIEIINDWNELCWMNDWNEVFLNKQTNVIIVMVVICVRSVLARQNKTLLVKDSINKTISETMICLHDRIQVVKKSNQIEKYFCEHFKSVERCKECSKNTKCHGFMKFSPTFLGENEIKCFTKQIT